MRISPIYSPTDTELITLYQEIKSDLKLVNIPTGLAYLGNFPTLLDFIWAGSRESLKQISPAQVDSLVADAGEILDLFLLPKQTFENKYQHLFSTIKIIACSQVRLALWAIAVRENIKGFGWTIARLDEARAGYSKDLQEQINSSAQADLIRTFGEITQTKHLSHQERSLQMNNTDSEGLGSFLSSLKAFLQNFSQSKESLFFRVELERLLQTNVAILESPIRFSFQQMLSLTQKLPNQQDYWYLVADYLPTLYTHELIASIVALRMLN